LELVRHVRVPELESGECRGVGALGRVIIHHFVFCFFTRDKSAQTLFGGGIWGKQD
jgi:hypothetical protein